MTTASSLSGTANASGNLRGIVAMVASQASFIINDSLIKMAARDLPGGQAIFLRGLFAFAAAVLAAKAMGVLERPLPRAELPRITLRSIGETGSTFCYLTALFHLPIADATAILQCMPLALTAAGAVFLAEPVGWRRWTATGVGFLGVMVIIRPATSAFNAWSLLVLVGVAFSVLRDLSTRRIAGSIPTMQLVVISAGVVTLAALTSAPFEAWTAPGPSTLLCLASAALFLLGGYYFIIDAMRHGEIAVVAPFRYSVILWAIAAGIVLFGERPDRWVLAGTAIVMGAGVYTFVRERHLACQRQQKVGQG